MENSHNIRVWINWLYSQPGYRQLRRQSISRSKSRESTGDTPIEHTNADDEYADAIIDEIKKEAIIIKIMLHNLH